MSDRPYLTDEQILEIVKPLTQPAAIIRWFRKNGFPNAVARPGGMPLIWKHEYESARQVSNNVPQVIDIQGLMKKLKKLPDNCEMR